MQGVDPRAPQSESRSAVWTPPEDTQLRAYGRRRAVVLTIFEATCVRALSVPKLVVGGHANR